MTRFVIAVCCYGREVASGYEMDVADVTKRLHDCRTKYHDTE